MATSRSRYDIVRASSSAKATHSPTIFNQTSTQHHRRRIIPLNNTSIRRLSALPSPMTVSRARGALLESLREGV